MKVHLASALNYHHIGAIHTHPYLFAEQWADLDFVRSNGCNFSKGDLESFKYKLDEIKKSWVADPYIVESVLTIKQVTRENIRRDGFLDGKENVFEFAIGNCKCFLRVQVLL